MHLNSSRLDQLQLRFGLLEGLLIVQSFNLNFFLCRICLMSTPSFHPPFYSLESYTHFLDSTQLVWSSELLYCFGQRWLINVDFEWCFWIVITTTFSTIYSPISDAYSIIDSTVILFILSQLLVLDPWLFQRNYFKNLLLAFNLLWHFVCWETHSLSFILSSITLGILIIIAGLWLE